MSSFLIFAFWTLEDETQFFNLKFTGSDVVGDLLIVFFKFHFMTFVVSGNSWKVQAMQKLSGWPTSHRDVYPT